MSSVPQYIVPVKSDDVPDVLAVNKAFATGSVPPDVVVASGEYTPILSLLAIHDVCTPESVVFVTIVPLSPVI